LFPGIRALDVAARICIFIALAASYDILLGYTGIVSFAHTLFFGLGAYSVAVISSKMDGSWAALAVGALVALTLSMVLALVIALFSLRVKAIFFSMITLALAHFFALLVAQVSDITGGVDGMAVAVPELLRPSNKLLEEPLWGAKVNGRFVSYYGVLVCCGLLFFVMRRIVQSPFGSVLQAIRENGFRAEAIGYRTITYRVLATCLSAGIAALAGVLMAVWLKYVGPPSTVSFEIMVDILLMVVIGGMGTLYGAAIGAVLMVLAHYYLQTVMEWLAGYVSSAPLLTAALHPDRWLLWLGLLFILSVYFFPQGIIGKLRGTPRARAH
jgi:branched-chain amino acid transport system permease protein